MQNHDLVKVIGMVGLYFSQSLYEGLSWTVILATAFYLEDTPIGQHSIINDAKEIVKLKVVDPICDKLNAAGSTCDKWRKYVWQKQDHMNPNMELER